MVTNVQQKPLLRWILDSLTPPEVKKQAEGVEVEPEEPGMVEIVAAKAILLESELDTTEV